ncbi:MAG: ferredoxin [Ruminococcaceae bacterium]|nr:ferredoxin [Oscillospiraceae bacterium]
MIRRIITIDETRCDGCGLCARACHEGAIGIVNGKAKLLREDYCDGLGDCLPACPQKAISFEEREAPAYDEAAVLAAKAAARPAQLRNFPVQLKLVPAEAPWFHKARLLIAADCTAFCHQDFYGTFIRDHILLVGCPKLDGVDYAVKLTRILQRNDIESVTVVRMSVPCCGGLTYAVQRALEASGKEIPLEVVTVRPDGTVAE